MRKKILLLSLLLLSSVFICFAQINPYLQCSAPTSINICWKTSSGMESTVNYGLSQNLEKTKSGTCQSLTDVGYAGGYYYHSAQLTGLEPNTRYYYQVKTGTQQSAILHFKTPPANGQGNSDGHLRFISIGDNQIPDKYTSPTDYRMDTMVAQVKRFCVTNYGADFNDCVNGIITCGDQVDVGSLSQYETTHFKRYAPLSGYLPVNTVIGNHETYGSMGLSGYDKHFFYKNALPAYKGISSGTNYYYALQVGNVLIINLSSEHTGTAQQNWAFSVIDSAKVDNTVDWVIFQAHRPINAEQYVGDISTWIKDIIVPKFATCSKTALFIGGHHHNYARGQLLNSPIYHIISGGASWDQYWNMSTEVDNGGFGYEFDVQKTISNWPWCMIDVDVVNKTLTVDVYTNGSRYRYKNNAKIDHFRLVKNQDAPNRPTITNAITESISLPYTFSSSAYSSTTNELLNTTHFQISATSDFSKIEKENVLDYENLFGKAGSLVDSTADLNKGVDILRWQLLNNVIGNGQHYIRVRHRDRSLAWSAWSEPVVFTVKGSVVQATEISTNKSKYSPNENIAVTYANTPGNAKDWIGIYKKGDVPGNGSASTKWSYISGTSGTVNFSLPTPGLYYAGLFLNDGYTEAALRKEIYVGTIPVLSSDKQVYQTTDNVVVSYSSAPANAADSVKVYKMGMVPGTNAPVRAKAVTAATGSSSFSGLEKGYYFATYQYKGTSYEPGDRIKFQVGSDITNLKTNKTSYNLNERIVVDFSDGPGNPKDWIGIYKQGADPQLEPLVKYSYVDGRSLGRVIFSGSDSLPTNSGNYYVALFPSDSYDIISNKAGFTILNQSPTCAISLSSSNVSFTEPASITMNADATDIGGTVSKVEFYQGTTKIGESTTSPYSFNWTDVKAGSYELTAKAIDNEGAVTISAPLSVKVLSATSVKSTKSDKDGKVYFKNGALAIELAEVDNYEISLYNTKGVRIVNDRIHNENKTTIPIGRLSAGMYVLKISSDQKQICKEVIVNM